MKLETKVITVRKKKVFCSKGEEGWALSLLEKGGPIVWDKYYDEALKKFKEALDVCVSVGTLLMVDRMIKSGASDEEVKEEMKNKMK